MANMEAPKQNITRLAPVTARDRNNRSGTSGLVATLASMYPKRPSSTAAMAPVVTVERDVHATWSVWTMVYTSIIRPAVTVTDPATSRRCLGPSARDSARHSRATRKRDTPIGTLTKRIHRHDRYWVRNPPNRAPAAPPPAATALHTPEGLGPGSLVGEGDGEDGQGGRGEDRRAHALDGPGRDQGGLVAGESPEQAGPGEQDQPQQEDPPPAEEVGQPAPEQQQPAEGQGVGGHHPLQVGGTESQIPLDGRQAPH